MDARGLLVRYGRQQGEARDGFGDRESERLMGTAPSGQMWRDFSNQGLDTNGIVTGGLFYSPSVAGTRALVDTGFADCRVQATLTTVANASRLYARSSDVPPATLANGIYVNVVAATSYVLTRLMAGATSGLGTYAVAPVDGDVVTLIARGNKLEVLINGTSRITATDGWNMGATRHGLGNGTTSGRWSAFSVTRV